MNFQKMPPVEPYKNHLDVAFHQAKLHAEVVKKKTKKKREPHIYTLKRIEFARFDTMRKFLVSRLDQIIGSFPEIDLLPVFYRELAETTLDIPALRKSLSSLHSAIKRINNLHSAYSRKVGDTKSGKTLHDLRNEFYGRVSSILERVSQDFTFLEQARRVMKNYPDIKDLPTVAIAGFPNVGKTTLLTKLSSARPEIAEYAFTTKHINVGYFHVDSREIQLLDTPGTLARPEKMNFIEQQAYLAIRHLANMIIYVFDPTEPYPIEDQEKLLALLKKEKKPILFYMSKSDITPKEKIGELTKKHPALITDATILQEKIIEIIKNK